MTFTRHLFDPGNPVLRETMDRLGEHRRHRAMVFIDAGVAAAHGDLAGEISGYFASYPDELELAGEPKSSPEAKLPRMALAWSRKSRDSFWSSASIGSRL